jgi:menaquinone-dependent protoporphyrinogen oxidase
MSSMRILVVFGSNMGGTAGLADMIGEALTQHGLDVTVRCAAERLNVDHYDAVVVAGAIYSGRWHRDARRFVRRYNAVLRQRPIWLVASGPLDGSARDATLAPIAHVAQAAALIGAQGSTTFGGWLAADAKGFLARAMAKKMAGDWRDPDQVAGFAEQVAITLAECSTR